MRPLQVRGNGVEAVVLPTNGLPVHEIWDLGSLWWESAIIGLVEGQCETDLPHVAEATRLVG